MRELEVHKIDVNKFLEAISKCKGDVYLVTDEGDRLNLMSKLSQLIGIANIIKGGVVEKAHLECDNPEDESMLFRFNLYGDSEL